MHSAEKIFRELSYIEAYRSKLKITGPNIGWQLLKIKSPIDFLTISDQIRNGLDKIRDNHPLLRCKIIADPNDEQKLFFAFVNNPDKMRKNFQLLFYESLNGAGQEDCIKYLLDKENNTNFESDEPLWKLVIVKVGCNSGMYDYYAYMSGYHAITDGCNGFSLFLSYMKILNNEEEVKTTEESVVTKNNPKITDHVVSIDPEEFYPLRPLPFLKVKLNVKPQSNDANTDGAFYTIDGKKYASLKEIGACRENYRVQVNLFSFDEEIYRRITNESQKRSVKLTSIFDFVTAIALKQVIDTYWKFDESIVSSNSVNLRSPLGIGNINPGLWMAYHQNTYSKELIDSVLNSKCFSNNFWSIAKAYSEKLETFIKSENALTYLEEQERTSRYIFLNQDKLRTDNLKLNFVLTYLNHEKLSNSKSKLIEITECFAGGFYAGKNKNYMAAHFISALNSHFNWTILFKIDDLSIEVVDLWAQHIKRILEKLALNDRSKL